MSIKKYWIQEIQNVEEFKAIADAIDPEILDLKKETTDMIDDQFIETATQEGIARREKMLKIQPYADDTLESRRFRVQSRWNDSLPYTHPQLNNKLNNLVGPDGYKLTINYSEFTLTLKINLGQKRMINDVNTVTRKMTPANMIISVELQYNRHADLSRYTHQQLSLRTHQQLREEVLY